MSDRQPENVKLHSEGVLVLRFEYFRFIQRMYGYVTKEREYINKPHVFHRTNFQKKKCFNCAALVTNRANGIITWHAQCTHSGEKLSYKRNLMESIKWICCFCSRKMGNDVEMNANAERQRFHSGRITDSERSIKHFQHTKLNCGNFGI